MSETTRKQADHIRWMGPVLDALRQLGGSGKPREVADRVAQNLSLTEKKLDETLKSGQSRFYNSVAWARQYLVWEGLLDSSKHGIWTLSPKGEITTLSDKQSRELVKKWVDIHRKAKSTDSKEEVSEEIITIDAEDNLLAERPTNLIDVLQSLSPSGFERVCQRLLRESGFENVVVTGKSHDGGIDGYGVLEINPFVSFKVLFQCKRYKGTVSRAQVGDFRNAMIGRAEKGIIITTGTFSSDATKEASRDGAPQIELVDGNKLVEMFKRVELGLKPKTVYEVDIQFFEPYMK
jgi:restriction system protein